MKRLILAGLLAASLCAANLWADATVAAPGPAPNEIDYVKQLPNPNDLANANIPPGATVSAISQTNTDVTVTYSFANGETRVVSYRLLSSTASATGSVLSATGSVPTPSTPAPVAVYDSTSPSYTVVYDQPAPVYYYPEYYPWCSPVSVRIGFHDGWGWGWGYHGGWHHGGWGWRGGWRH
jgi:hypothetical protein